MVNLLYKEQKFSKLYPEQNKGESNVNQSRLKTIIVIFSFVFILLSIRLFDVSLFQQNKKYTQNSNHDVTIRPNITDSNGVILAINLDTASLYANPQIILDHQEAASKLIQVFPELNYKQLLADFSSNKTFVWIKRNLTPKEQFEVNNLGIPGLSFENTSKRIYTHGNLFSHIIGFVGMDGHGLAGIEKYYDQNLLTSNEATEQITLSIDSRIQNIVSEELTKAMDSFHAIGAVGIVMNAKTGELLSTVSLPSFDPHNISNASSEQMFNRFSLGLYEPGSIFKTFTMAMALDSEIISLNDVYDVNSPIINSQFKITDYHAKGGNLSVPEIFIYSSNIGSAKISMDIGKKLQHKFLKNFGLLDALDIELYEKATPLYPKINKWNDLSTMTISYGHGIAITPLHMITAANAMINGGILHKPTFLKKNNLEKHQEKRVIKPQTSALMQKLYRLVVEYGTGKRANVRGYLVGGKTGTADKVTKGIYNKNSRLSSFIAAFPIHDPQYTLLIMIDEPKGNQYTGGYATAGVTAAPVCGNIISRIAILLGMNLIDEDNDSIIKHLTIDYQDNLDHEL